MTKNPFLVALNVPVNYKEVSAKYVKTYTDYVIKQSINNIKTIEKVENPNFENVFGALDNVYNQTYTASNHCFMLYWVSPDADIRKEGLEGYQRIETLQRNLYSNKALFEKMEAFKKHAEYRQLNGPDKLLVDDLISDFELSGVRLEADKLEKFKSLANEINVLSAAYSSNMNASEDTLIIDEKGAEGLTENFKNTYKTKQGTYEIPIINATREPILKNAAHEKTRKDYYLKLYNRAADKNLAILDSLVHKRYELAQILGFSSYADFYLKSQMAKNPSNVWAFINDLVERVKPKAKKDIETLIEIKNAESDTNSTGIKPWDIDYFHNQILQKKFKVDYEKVREFLPIDACIEGIFEIYQELLAYEFSKVENPSLWHEEVTQYEVYEQGKLKGRFYLDLFPRPNKESWFYGVQICAGKATPEGYQVPESMLLGNFTRPTDELPSLVSFDELNTLFHEFGHIMDAMSYNGKYALQADAKSDFVESMSQLFENWIWDYEMLSKFAKHYQTGEVLPKKIFDNMLAGKNVSSGFYALSSLRKCMYDLNLYHKYSPKTQLNTTELWNKIDEELNFIPLHADGTHYQASWIHINTHPVYYYGYLWAEVYAQDLFTKFEKNGLLHQKTGLAFRKLILSNGKQREAAEVVEEFLGRKSNNKAYIKSLGL